MGVCTQLGTVLLSNVPVRSVIGEGRLSFSRMAPAPIGNARNAHVRVLPTSLEAIGLFLMVLGRSKRNHTTQFSELARRISGLLLAFCSNGTLKLICGKRVVSSCSSIQAVLSLPYAV